MISLKNERFKILKDDVNVDYVIDYINLNTKNIILNPFYFQTFFKPFVIIVYYLLNIKVF